VNDEFQAQNSAICLLFNKIYLLFNTEVKLMIHTKFKMIYWKGEKYWLGKLLEHPEIMSQGKTLDELEENLKDAYLIMVLDDVPQDYELKEIAV